MSARIGVGIAADSVRAVLVGRDEAVRWHAEVPRGAGGLDGLATALREVLAAVPGRPWPRRRVVIALGPHCTQLRLLSELPPLARAADVARAVNEGSHRFFLRNGAPLVTGSVRLVDDRRAWAVAFEKPVVDTVITCCRAARVRLVAIVPAAAVLHAGVVEDQVDWLDGAVRARIEYEGASVRAFTRLASFASSTTAGPGAVTPHDRLAALGHDAWRFADAFGAATAGAREPLRVQGSALTARESRAPAWRRAASLAAAAFALAMAAIAPGASAWRAETQAETALRSMAEERRGVTITARELERVTEALAEGAEFVRHRRSHLRLLAGLTTALPADAWVMAIRTDSAGGHVVTLGNRAAAVLAAMDSVGGIAGAQFLGPVTREVAGTREVERATIRFRWNDRDCALRAPQCAASREDAP